MNQLHLKKLSPRLKTQVLKAMRAQIKKTEDLKDYARQTRAMSR